MATASNKEAWISDMYTKNRHPHFLRDLLTFFGEKKTYGIRHLD